MKDIEQKMFDRLVEKLRLIHRPNEKKPWVELIYDESENIHDFIYFINNLNNISGLNAYKQPLLFRGQTNSEWPLEPKIYRLLKKFSKEEALRIEFDSLKYFKQRAHLFLSSPLIPKDKKMGEWLALMQHYSAPTRMLDWTTSFNVAAYFAVTDEPVERSGAIWFFGVNSLYKYMKRYKDPPESELKKILEDEDEFVKYGLDNADPKIETYDISIKSERMIAQHTIFTYCYQLFSDHAILIGNSLLDCHRKDRGTDLLFKIVITQEVKRKLREYLNKLNISASTLFPGADGVGRAITEMINLRYDVFCR